MRRNPFIGVLVLLLASTLVPFAAGQLPGSGATAAPDHIELSWTDASSTTMTVTWRTDSTVTSGFIQYQKGKALSRSAKQAKANPRDFATDLGATRLFSSTLVKLSPNTTYAYRVGDGEHWSEVRSFRTAERKPKAFKFLVFGDSQSSVTGDRPYGDWHDTLHNAYNANPDARFLVNVGDLVDWGQRGVHWNAWFAAAAGVIDKIPEMPVPGNHETFGSKETTRPAYWASQFTLPRNGPEGLKGQVYSYDYGPVHFVVLDSQIQEQKTYGDLGKIQQEWLDADLTASKAQWKVLFFHKSAYEIMPKRINEDVRAAFCPVIDKHHVDLVFSAHDHGVARTYPMRNGVNMETTSKGTVYYVSGRSGQKTYQNLQKMPWDSFFYDPQDQPNYLVVEASKSKMTIRVVKRDGTVLDAFVIEKK